jgi:DNA-directed RNA polymerase specialized sigma24 family protein
LVSQGLVFGCEFVDQQDIADILQISDEAVRSNLYKARRTLAASLHEEGISRD